MSGAGGRKIGSAVLDGFMPRPSPEIRAELSRLQFERLRGQIPFLYGVGTFSMLLIIWLAILGGASTTALSLLATIPLFSLWRIAMWGKEVRTEFDPASRERFINRAVLMGAGMLTLCSLVAIYCFLERALEPAMILPISLAFGTICIAFSFSPIPWAAIAFLALGIMPCALALIIDGDVLGLMVAFSSVSVGLLLVRFIGEHYRQILGSLHLEHRIRQQAVRDPLTGALNRRGFDAEVEKYLLAGETMALGLIDLDDFKAINDRRGHSAGDAVLQSVPERLTVTLPNGAVIGRYGGDEFAFLISGESAAADLAAIVRRSLDAICQAVPHDGSSITPTASLGVAVGTGGQSLAEILYSDADAALYTAKSAGKRRAVVRHADGSVIWMDALPRSA